MKVRTNKKLKSEDMLIMKAVETATGIEDFYISKTRRREYVDARRIAYKIFRVVKGYSYARIGSMFNKDHATVLFGVNTTNSLMDVDPHFKENYLESLAAVGGIDGRKARIREKINELKQELLTLEKQEDYV
jgi:chromosomal replication initiation ATPase DnaA|tara:strand:- start:928 stop:1323 length:396 start_codon:yes stop_codon:yes gene_type:complete